MNEIDKKLIHSDICTARRSQIQGKYSDDLQNALILATHCEDLLSELENIEKEVKNFICHFHPVGVGAVEAVMRLCETLGEKNDNNSL